MDYNIAIAVAIVCVTVCWRNDTVSTTVDKTARKSEQMCCESKLIKVCTTLRFHVA